MSKRAERRSRNQTNKARAIRKLWYLAPEEAAKLANHRRHCSCFLCSAKKKGNGKLRRSPKEFQTRSLHDE